VNKVVAQNPSMVLLHCHYFHTQAVEVEVEVGDHRKSMLPAMRLV